MEDATYFNFLFCSWDFGVPERKTFQLKLPGARQFVLHPVCLCARLCANSRCLVACPSDCPHSLPVWALVVGAELSF